MTSRTIPFRIVTSTIRGITSALLKIDKDQFEAIPKEGPLIITTNHINFLDVPALYTNLVPRDITGFAKDETWDNPVMGYLFDLWGAIPIKRGEADTTALRQAFRVLKDGKILAVAPEGTRSGDGRLLQGKPGTALIALRSKAPILPVGFWGNEQFKENLPRLQRTEFRIKVGEPFILHDNGEKVTSDVRRKMTDEIMYQIAALLPEVYRGVYTDLDAATTNYLRFE